MTKGQEKLLQICRKHIEHKELKEAIEIIDAIFEGERLARKGILARSEFLALEEKLKVKLYP